MLSSNTNKSNQYITITISITKVKMYESKYIGWYGIGTILRMSKKAINRLQCIWVAMIDEIYKLIIKYLKNKFR